MRAPSRFRGRGKNSGPPEPGPEQRRAARPGRAGALGMGKARGRGYIVAMAQTSDVLYDTHAAIRRLTGAGMPEPHAEAVVREQVHLIEHNLATKADIEKLRQETRADIEKLRQETKAGIEKLRLETRADIETAKLSLIKWMVATNITLVALVIAAFKLL